MIAKAGWNIIKWVGEAVDSSLKNQHVIWSQTQNNRFYQTEQRRINYGDGDSESHSCALCAYTSGMFA